MQIRADALASLFKCNCFCCLVTFSFYAVAIAIAIIGALYPATRSWANLPLIEPNRHRHHISDVLHCCCWFFFPKLCEPRTFSAYNESKSHLANTEIDQKTGGAVGVRSFPMPSFYIYFYCSYLLAFGI